MIGPFARFHLSILAALTFVAASVPATPALAAGSNMPWEQPLQQILQSIEGPVSKIIAFYRSQNGAAYAASRSLPAGAS